MKRGTPDHPKTAELAELLGLAVFSAVGLLEMLWHFTASYAPRGDVGQFTDRRIAKGLGWRKDPGKLVAAMVSSGWLDTDPTHRLLVHHWAEHADQGVSRRLARMGQAFAAPTTSQRLDTSSQSPDMSSLARARAVAVHKPEPQPPAWPDGSFADAKAMWRKRSGCSESVVNAPSFGKDWGGLIVEHGWPTVRLALAAYLAATEIKYLKPARFAETFGEWRSKAGPPPAGTQARHLTPEFREEERRAAEERARKASA